MTRRILATGLAGAALFAAVLGTAAPAQAPTPEPTVLAAEATAVTTPEATATETPPAETAQPPAATETSTPTPFPSPVETTVATPTATETPARTPDATTTPAPTAPAKGIPAPEKGLGVPADRPKRRKDARRRPNTGTATGKVGECGELVGTVVSKDSTSTSGRACKKPDADQHDLDEQRRLTPEPVLIQTDGSPAPTNPDYSLATVGAARIGVPNFFIDKFRIPPFLLPIYQAAGMQYGVRWEILAAINEIETDYGRNLNVSYAGALGWMQFMPPTWRAYGVDANRDGMKDPYNPVDAIFAAARYLKAAGADTDIRKAVFAYNHANWYVDSVLMRAQVIGGLPSDLVGSLTGLTQGRFPVHAKATYAGQVKRGKRIEAGNAAVVVEGDDTRRNIEIFSRPGAPVVAVNDGRVLRFGRSRRLGRYVTLRDVYGNTYTYANLGSVSATYPAPKPRKRLASTSTRDGVGHSETRADAKRRTPALKKAGRGARGGRLRRCRRRCGLAADQGAAVRPSFAARCPRGGRAGRRRRGVEAPGDPGRPARLQGP